MHSDRLNRRRRKQHLRQRRRQRRERGKQLQLSDSLNCRLAVALETAAGSQEINADQPDEETKTVTSGVCRNTLSSGVYCNFQATNRRDGCDKAPASR